MAGKVDVSVDGGVAAVTLDSPGKLNAVSVAMWQGIARVFEEIGDAESLRVVVIRGAGGNFAAGADIDEFDRVRHDPSSGRKYHLETIGNALSAIDRCPVPLIAAIEGVCVGGGLEIASLCDIRLAADTARFGVPIGRLGFPLALPELVPLLRLVGPAVAAEMLLESRILSADEAEVRRLVTRVVPAAAFETELQLCITPYRRRLATGRAAEQGQHSPLPVARTRLHAARARRELRVSRLARLPRGRACVSRQTPAEFSRQVSR